VIPSGRKTFSRFPLRIRSDNPAVSCFASIASDTTNSAGMSEFFHCMVPILSERQRTARQRVWVFAITNQVFSGHT
jgi:hypothetical protein